MPNRPLKRYDAIRIITETLKGNEFIIASTGKPSRELFTIKDQPQNFYMQGSMGHASAIGLGVALAHPNKKVVILDGDGALLMHMGMLSSIGHYQPKNLIHLVLDNEAYETTGDQDTTSTTSDFVKIALGSGYQKATEVSEEAALRASVTEMVTTEGPSLLRIKINRLPTPKIPRITTKYTADEITENFSSALKKK